MPKPETSRSQKIVSFSTSSASTMRFEIDLWCSLAMARGILRSRSPSHHAASELGLMMSASMLPATLAAETFSVSCAR